MFIRWKTGLKPQMSAWHCQPRCSWLVAEVWEAGSRWGQGLYPGADWSLKDLKNKRKKQKTKHTKGYDHWKQSKEKVSFTLKDYAPRLAYKTIWQRQGREPGLLPATDYLNVLRVCDRYQTGHTGNPVQRLHSSCETHKHKRIKTQLPNKYIAINNGHSNYRVLFTIDSLYYRVICG